MSRFIHLLVCVALLLPLLACGGGGGDGGGVAFELPSSPPLAPGPTRPAPEPEPTTAPSPNPTSTPDSSPPNVTVEEPLTRQLPERSLGADRWVVLSTQRGLTDLDRNDHSDIYLRDLLLGKVQGFTLRADGPSDQASISEDGRFVVFRSAATNLVSNHQGSKTDIYLWNRLAKTFTCLTEGADADSSDPTISADGEVIAFSSKARLLPTDTNTHADIYLYARQSGQLSLLQGTQTGDAVSPTLNSDGSLAAYVAKQFGYWQIFGWSRDENSTALLSRNSENVAGNGDSFYPSLSDAGLVYSTKADNLIPSDTNGKEDVLALVGNTLTRVAEDASSPVLSRTTLDGLYIGSGRVKLLRPTVSPVPSDLASGQAASISTSRVLTASDGDQVIVLPDKAISKTLNSPYRPSPPVTGFPFQNVGIARYGRVLRMDLNNDGLEDVVSQADDEAEPRGFVLALANPDGTFESNYFSVGGWIQGYDQGDINGDGLTDVVVTVRNGTVYPPSFYTLKTYFGDGTGSFVAGPTRTVTQPLAVPFLGHLQGDTHTDILLFSRTWDDEAAAPPRILVGNGTGQFLDGAVLPISNSPGHPTLGDYNSDGIDDIAALDNSTGEVAVMLNNGQGAALSPIQRIAVGAPGQLRYRNGFALDSDLDGDTDLLVEVGNPGGPHNVQSLVNNGAGSFGLGALLPIETIGFAYEENPIVSGDFNGDGYPEYLLRTWHYDPRTGATRQFSHGIQGAVAARDINDDGVLDVLLQRESGLTYVFGNGDGSFGPSTAAIGENLYLWGPLGDFNGDLLMDVVGYQTLLFGQANKTFKGPQADLEPRDSRFVEDFDGDGRLDLLDYDGDSFQVHLGDEEGNFQPLPIQSVPTLWGIAPEIQDIDQDGHVDLFVIRHNGNTNNSWEFWRGNGDGTFTVASSVIHRSSTSLIHLADINNDGFVDVWASDVIILATAAGEFSAPSNIPYGDPSGGFSDAAFGDFDGDGRTEGFGFPSGYSPAWDYYPNAPEPSPYVFENPWMFQYNGMVSTITATFLGEKRQGQQNRIGTPISEDIDNDGDLDLRFLDGFGNMHLATNNGDGTYTQAPATYLDAAALSIHRLDYDFDGQFERLATGYKALFLP